MLVAASQKKPGHLSLHDLSVAEYVALLQAVQHEVVRSQMRLKDERISEQTRNREQATHNILNASLRVFLAFEAQATAATLSSMT